MRVLFTLEPPKTNTAFPTTAALCRDSASGITLATYTKEKKFAVNL